MKTEILVNWEKLNVGKKIRFGAGTADWKNISFKGLKARGNFTVDCDFVEGKVNYLKVKSEAGTPFILRYEGINDKTIVKKLDGSVVDFKTKDIFVEFNTQKGEVYIIENLSLVSKREIVQELTAQWTDEGVKLSWNDCGKECAIYRAVDNDSDYELLGQTKTCEFIDGSYNTDNRKRITYKVVVCGQNHNSATVGALVAMHTATQLEEERYKLRFLVNNKIF